MRVCVCRCSLALRVLMCGVCLSEAQKLQRNNAIFGDGLVNLRSGEPRRQRNVIFFEACRCRCVVVAVVGVNKSENSGLTSVDRSTRATLSTYNTWIQVSRLQKIYHFQRKKLRFTTTLLSVAMVKLQKGRDLIVVMCQRKWWTTLLSQHGFRLRGVQS